MPIYEFRCPECRNVTQGVYSVTSFPREVPCQSCGAVAYKIISLPQPPIVDNTDRQGYNIGAGRYFSNKGEIREYCRTQGKVLVGSEGEAKMKENLQRMQEEKAASR